MDRDGGFAMKSLPKGFFVGLNLLLVAGLAARPAAAVGLTEFTIDHSDPQCTVRQIEDGAPVTPAGKALNFSPAFQAGKGNKVVITFIHPNPLLFQYSAKKGAVTKTSNQANLEQFADTALAPFLSSLKGAAGGAAAPAGAPPQTCKDKIRPLKILSQEVPILDALAASRTDIATLSLDNPTKAKELVGKWPPLSQLAKDLADAKKDLADIRHRTAGSTASKDEVECAAQIIQASAEIPNLEQTLKDLTQFADLVGQIDRPISIDLFTVDPGSIQTVEIEFTQTKAWPENLRTARCVGKGTFTVEPRSKVAITTFAPALVYSFVRDSAFTAKASGGQFVVTEARSEYKALDLAAMLQIEPNHWDLGPLSLGVQLGVSPQKNLGLFLGLSLRAIDLFTLGAGVAFQRVDRLQTGLQVGQVLSSQDLLKTEKRFQTGLYIHLTVSQKKKS
jgi:hypothetical protein